MTIKSNGSANTVYVQEVFTSSAVWVKPGNVTKVDVFLLNGGGGGGGGRRALEAANGGGGGGGGGGAAAYFEDIDVSDVFNVPITVGAGGTGGVGAAGNGTSGTSGGLSLFGNLITFENVLSAGDFGTGGSTGGGAGGDAGEINDTANQIFLRGTGTSAVTAEAITTTSVASANIGISGTAIIRPLHNITLFTSGGTGSTGNTTASSTNYGVDINIVGRGRWLPRLRLFELFSSVGSNGETAGGQAGLGGAAGFAGGGGGGQGLTTTSVSATDASAGGIGGAGGGGGANNAGVGGAGGNAAPISGAGGGGGGAGRTPDFGGAGGNGGSGVVVVSYWK
jgi:hypothetical protein